MSISIPQRSFTGGEWAPSLYARVDLAKYATAVRQMTNAYPHPHGGVSNRGGLEFIVKTKYPDKKTRLYPFQFSVEQGYILEFGDQYIRFIKDGIQITDNLRTTIEIVNSSVYKWTASGGGTNEYYLELLAGGDPSIAEPTYIWTGSRSSNMEKGTLGSLGLDEWDYGDNDSLGYSTIYVRLSDGADPDVKIDGFLEAVYITSTSIRDSTLKWTLSSSGTNEYYVELIGGGNPSISKPANIYDHTTSINSYLNEGGAGLGGLLISEWGYGDNDSLGYNTIYIRLSDGTDPDTRIYGTLEALYPIEVITNYLENDLELLKFTQNADYLKITHPSYPPAELTRTSHVDWNLNDIVFAANISPPTNFIRSAGSGSSNTYAVTAVLLTGEESVPSNTAVGDAGDTFSWDAVSDADYYVLYQVKNGVYGFLGIAQTNSYVTESGVEPDMNDTAPNARDPFDSADNYPGVSTFYEQRWLAARTNNYPQNIWGSVIGAFNNMNTSIPLKSDDSFNFQINSQQVNEIRWLVPLEALIIGTSGGEFRMTSGSNSDAISPTSVDIKRQSYWGVSHVPPIIIGNSVIFIGRSKAIVRDLTYSLEVDGYTGNELSILANHLFKGFTINEWSYQQYPDSIIWAVRNDGILLGLTYQKEHQVWGWHKHNTQGFFKSTASISTLEGDDEAYFVIERNINGENVQYIERFRNRLPRDQYGNYSIKDAFFVDSGLTYDVPYSITNATKTDPVVITISNHPFENGDIIEIVNIQGMIELNDYRYKVANKTTNTFEITDLDGNDIDGSNYEDYISGGKARKAITTVKGLNHLENETVTILADGNVVADKIVTNGQITLTLAAARIHIGLQYDSIIETLDFEMQTETGTLQDKLRTIDSVLLELENTRGFFIGPNADRLEEYFPEGRGVYLPLSNADAEISIEDGIEREGRIYVKNVDPIPLTILSITARITPGER